MNSSIALFSEELTQIAEDVMSHEFSLKIQNKFMNHWIDREFIPEIARECYDEVTSHYEEELDQRDRLAIESPCLIFLSCLIG